MENSTKVENSSQATNLIKRADFIQKELTILETALKSQNTGSAEDFNTIQTLKSQLNITAEAAKPSAQVTEHSRPLHMQNLETILQTTNLFIALHNAQNANISEDENKKFDNLKPEDLGLAVQYSIYTNELPAVTNSIASSNLGIAKTKLDGMSTAERPQNELKKLLPKDKFGEFYVDNAFDQTKVNTLKNEDIQKMLSNQTQKDDISKFLKLALRQQVFNSELERLNKGETAEVKSEKKVNIAAMTAEEIQELTVEQIAKLTQEEINELKADKIDKLTIKQIKALGKNISLLLPWQITLLTTTQVQALTRDQIQALKDIQVMQLKITALTPEQIKALETDQIPHLTLAQIKALTTAQIKALKTEQLEVMTQDQFNAMTREQLDALTKDQLEKLKATKPEKIKQIEKAQIKTQAMSENPPQNAPHGRFKEEMSMPIEVEGSYLNESFIDEENSPRISPKSSSWSLVGDDFEFKLFDNTHPQIPAPPQPGFLGDSEQAIKFANDLFRYIKNNEEVFTNRGLAGDMGTLNTVYDKLTKHYNSAKTNDEVQELLKTTKIYSDNGQKILEKISKTLNSSQIEYIRNHGIVTEVDLRNLFYKLPKEARKKIAELLVQTGGDELTVVLQNLNEDGMNSLNSIIRLRCNPSQTAELSRWGRSDIERAILMDEMINALRERFSGRLSNQHLDQIRRMARAADESFYKKHGRKMAIGVMFALLVTLAVLMLAGVIPLTYTTAAAGLGTVSTGTGATTVAAGTTVVATAAPAMTTAAEVTIGIMGASGLGVAGLIADESGVIDKVKKSLNPEEYEENLATEIANHLEHEYNHAMLNAVHGNQANITSNMAGIIQSACTKNLEYTKLDHDAKERVRGYIVTACNDTLKPLLKKLELIKLPPQPTAKQAAKLPPAPTAKQAAKAQPSSVYRRDSADSHEGQISNSPRGGFTQALEERNNLRVITTTH